MQGEKLSYPYVPGEYGIDFCDSINQFNLGGKTSGTIHGGSGAEMEFWFGTNAISVSDITYPDRGMSAYLLNGLASFSLQTRSMLTDEREDEPNPHPDMFAAKFVKFALDYFGSTGEVVNVCKAEWNNPSLNWDTFVAELQEDGDKVRAAKQTWTGKLFTALGFSQIEAEDITFKNSGTRLIIYVMFHRPSDVNIH